MLKPLTATLSQRLKRQEPIQCSCLYRHPQDLTDPLFDCKGAWNRQCHRLDDLSLLVCAQNAPFVGVTGPCMSICIRCSYIVLGVESRHEVDSLDVRAQLCEAFENLFRHLGVTPLSLLSGTVVAEQRRISKGEFLEHGHTSYNLLSVG